MAAPVTLASFRLRDNNACWRPIGRIRAGRSGDGARTASSPSESRAPPEEHILAPSNRHLSR